MIEIERWDNGSVIHSGEFSSIKECLEDGIRKGVDFSHAELNDAKLNDAKLNFAELNRAELNRAELNFAELNDAKLNDAKLNRAKLNRAELNRAKLNFAELNFAVSLVVRNIGYLFTNKLSLLVVSHIHLKHGET